MAQRDLQAGRRDQEVGPRPDREAGRRRDLEAGHWGQDKAPQGDWDSGLLRDREAKQQEQGGGQHDREARRNQGMRRQKSREGLTELACGGSSEVMP